MDRSNGSNLSLWIFGGAVAGACLGYFLPDYMLATKFIGQFFMGALAIIIIPLLISSLIGKISELGDLRKIGRVSSRVFGYFLGTSVVAVIIGLIFVLVLQPGSSVSPDSQALSTWPSSIYDLLGGLLPLNIFAGISSGQYLGLTLLSIILGSLLFSSGIKGRSITTFFRELNSVLTDATSLLLKVAPIGLLSLIGAAVANDNGIFADAGRSLSMFILTVFLALIVYGFIILPLVLRFLGSESPFKFIVQLAPALLTGFGTASSAAAYPVTYECLTKKGEIDNRSASFILPLGMSLNAGGSAIFLVITTLFLAQMAGITLSFVQILTISAVSLLASFLLGGLPSAALLALPVVIATSGLPLSITAGVGMIVAVDWLLDRGRTVVNIWSDAVGAAVIADTYEFKTARRGLKPRPPLRASSTSSRTTRGTSRRGESVRPDQPERRDRKDGKRGEDRRKIEKTPSRNIRKDRSLDDSRDSRAGRSRSTDRSGVGRTKSNRETSSPISPSPFDLTASTTPAIGMPEIPAKEKVVEKSKSTTETKNTNKRDGRSLDKTKERRPARTRKPSSTTTSSPTQAYSNEQTKAIAPMKSKEDKEPVTQAIQPKPRLNPDIIARELASVSAHLEMKNGKKESEEIADSPKFSQQTEIKMVEEPVIIPNEVVEEKPKTADPVELQEPIVTIKSNDAIVDTTPFSPTTVEESKPEIPEPVAVESAASIQFGRSKSKRGDALKKNSKDKEANSQVADQESEKPTTTVKSDNYTTDGAVFGRGKKKKV